MSTVALPVLTYTDAEGNPLSNGYLLIKINTDAQSTAGQLCAGLTVRVPLDSSGVVLGSHLFWPTSQLLPNNTVYILSAFTAQGQLVVDSYPFTI